jgi:hypothetical protein
MPPTGAVEFGAEAVGERLSGSNRALRNLICQLISWPVRVMTTYTRSSVIPRSALLEESVPVHGSTLVEIVCDFDLNPITLRLLETAIYIRRGLLLTQLASMSGPGNWPLTTRSGSSTPSGAIVWLVTVHS